MSKQNFTIKLDFFPGFYESWLENSDTEYYAINEEMEWQNIDERPGVNLEYDDFEFDYKQRRDDIIEVFINVWKRLAPSIVEDVKFDHMWSPRYYNFDTDEVYVNVKLSKNWVSQMRAFMKENKEWLKNRIHEDWTSYDGFMSFMDNEFYLWDNHLFKELDTRYIGTMITYMIMVEENPNSARELRNDICSDVLEEIYDHEYISFSESGKEKVSAYDYKHPDPSVEPPLFKEEDYTKEY